MPPRTKLAAKRKPKIKPSAASRLPNVMTTADICAVSGYEPSDISMFQKAGMIRSLEKDGYSFLWPIPETLFALFKHLKDSAMRRAGTSASKVAIARESEIRLKMDIRSGALIPQERAEAVVALWAGRVRSALGAVAPRSTRDNALRKTIEAEIDSALRRACDQKLDDAELFDSEAGGEDGAPASGDTLD
jgi:hypothetical protein